MILLRLVFMIQKNITSGGEGGLLVLNNKNFIERAKIIREKGTNRSKFFEGIVDKYTWVDKGSSYLLSDLLAAYLWVQLNNLEDITQDRLNTWFEYDKALSGNEFFELMSVPDYNEHNAHMYFVKLKGNEQRASLIQFLKHQDIHAHSHYIPLHSSEAGIKYGTFCGTDKVTSFDSSRLLRLPLWHGMKKEQVNRVVGCVLDWCRNL